MRPGGRDGGKGDVFQRARFAPKRLQGLGRGDLAQLALRRLAVEPAKKARHRGAVAQVRGARAGELGLVLDRLHQRDRIGADDRRPARRLQRLGEARRRARRVEGDAQARGAEPRHEAGEPIGLVDVGQCAEPRAHRAGQFAPVDEQRRSPLARQIGEAQRQRRMRDVGAADVEQPGDGVRVADEEAVFSLEGGADAGHFSRRALAGQTRGMRAHRAERRFRAVLPDRVDWVRSRARRARRRRRGTPC